MSDTFNLKKFLTENKLTQVSRLVKEISHPSFTVNFKKDPELGYEYLDLQNDLIVPSDTHENLSGIKEELVNLILKNSSTILEVKIEGLDNLSDGTEMYQKVNKEIFPDLAQIIAQYDEDYYELAHAIVQGEYPYFLIMQSLTKEYEVLFIEGKEDSIRSLVKFLQTNLN